MQHRKTNSFRKAFEALPLETRQLADKSFQLLKANPKHPSLHFKRVPAGWSARVGIHHRALAVERTYGFLWYWIGSHADYGRGIRG